MTAVIRVENLSKVYVLHAQGGARIPAFSDISLDVHQGECLTLSGPSGAGKSTLLRCLYGNCLPTEGSIRIRHDAREVELRSAAPRDIISLRRFTIGYVSQFLRAIPRVSAIDVIAVPARLRGEDEEIARTRACALLERLRIPERLWALPPATFSGGEQQRVNIARGFAGDHPILLLDEPTASLDAVNRRVVIDMIEEAKTKGRAIVGVFHDEEVRDAVSNRVHLLEA